MESHQTKSHLISILSSLPVHATPFGLSVPSLGDSAADDIERLTQSFSYIEESRILSLLSSTERGILPKDEARITQRLRSHPEIRDRIPRAPSDLQAYAQRCRDVLAALVGLEESPETTNRMIRDVVKRPMDVVRHNLVAGLLCSNIERVDIDTLFGYLDAVEATCNVAGAHTVAHHVKLAAGVFQKAIDGERRVAEVMAVELSSFCLSYAKVKEAADLYKRVCGWLKGKQGGQ